ncbi:hypothetical protein OUZ56_007966 [Daphnia magna]|uniref:Uncharacterized protein n=1 Tax=Daphnia magna TaxID=35525 RepID=A0ABR0ABJ2_9CRUS|nr:hypothetical protein OUZ56_007966 [Daphnia magna]
MEETEGQSGNGLHAWEWRFNSPVVLCTKIHAPLDPFPSSQLPLYPPNQLNQTIDKNIVTEENAAGIKENV